MSTAPPSSPRPPVLALRLRDWLGQWRVILCSVAVGVIAGFGALLFFSLSEWLVKLCLEDLAGYHAIPPRGESPDSAALPPESYASVTISPLWILVLPTVGGLLVGWLVWRFAPDAKGHGTDGAVGAYHEKRGAISPAVIWVKTVASAITLGTGGSGGREGPIAQIGAGFGSWLAKSLRLTARERRLLLAAGMGAGVAAIFRAPLAGALFAAEILYRDSDFESEVVVPSLISSIIGYSVFTSFHGAGSLFAVNLSDNRQFFTFDSALELVPYLALAFVVVLFARAYIHTFYACETGFDRLRMPPWLKPALGGLMTGALGLGLLTLFGDGRVLNVIGFGYGAVQEAFDLAPAMEGDPFRWKLIGLFLVVAVGKMLTTGFTIGSGGSAGVFGPSMVIGGSVGAAVGLFFHHLDPDLVRHPGSFAIVGMAGFFTAVAHTPISTIIMVSEMTGNYELLVPAMGVAAVCFLLCRNVGIYSKQVPNRRDSPAHRGEFIVDVLEGIRVRDLLPKLRPPDAVHHRESLRTMIGHIDRTRSHYFPVLDDDDALVGIFSINDVRRYLHDETVWDLLVAADLMVPAESMMKVDPEADLGQAMRRFTQRNIDELPVVATEDPTKLLGMLGRREVIGAYNGRLDAESAAAREHS